MAVSNLRRANTVESSLAERLAELSTSCLSLQSISSHVIEPLSEDYPFSQQSHRGTIIYEEPSNYTPGRDIEIDFEYRDGSELFILEFQTDVDSVDRIARSIADAIPQQFTVYRNLHVPEDALWAFLEEADSIIQIHVLHEGKETPYQEVENIPREKVVGKSTIESAEVGFVIDEHQIVVRYQQGSLQIETNWSDGREYIIQLFEREVMHNS